MAGAGGVIFDVDGTLLDTNYLRRRPGLGLHVVLATSAKDEEIDLMLDALDARDSIGTVVSSGATEIYADAADLLGKIPASAIGQLAERTGE